MRTTITKGGINIEMTNICPKETEKLRYIFTQLIQVQVHRIKGGRAVLHFDGDGNMRRIEIQRIVKT